MSPRVIASTVATAALAGALLAGGCGSRPGVADPDTAVSVVATTTQVGDFARAVGGRRASVDQILEPNSDPHEYEPRPSDARAVENADVVLRSGGDLDTWTSALTESGGHARLVTLSGAVHKRSDDPHWWQDPRNAVLAVAAIRDALVRADPAGGPAYDRNAARYTARLERLDRSVAACVARVPRAGRKLVTSHDALGYYAHRYGLRLVGTVIPSLSSQAQPSSRDVNRLVSQIRRERVEAIFPESSLNPKLERAVSRESGATGGGALWADTLGPRGSSGSTYIRSIQANTAAIVRGLSGGRTDCRPRA